MRLILPLLALLACNNTPTSSGPPAAAEPLVPAATEPVTQAPADAPAEPGALACDSAAPQRCNTDADCACGVDRASGACAFGTAACIDTGRQCPDFCSGITGTMQLVCEQGTCAQRLGAPPSPK